MKRLTADRYYSHQVTRHTKLRPKYGGNRSGARFLSKLVFLLIVSTTAVTTTLTPMAVHPEGTVSPHDIDGWRNTRWGMTEAEVEAALPGEVVRFTAPDKRGTTKTSLRIEDFKLVGHRFTVHFSFEPVTRRLISVSLLLKEKNARTGERAFHGLEQGITEKYGSAIYRNERRRRGVMGLEIRNKATWRLKKTKIELDFSLFGAGISVFYLNYSPLTVQKSRDEKL